VIDSAIAAGTMKALPAGLPETILPVWVGAIEAEEMKDAA